MRLMVLGASSLKLRMVAAVGASCLLGWTGSAYANSVTDWNEVTVRYVAGGGGIPAGRPGPVGFLDVALVQAAVHDAVQAIEGRYEAYYFTGTGTGSKDAAVAAAAGRMAPRKIQIVLPLAGPHRLEVPCARIPALARFVVAPVVARVAADAAMREVEIVLALAGSHRLEVPGARVPAFFAPALLCGGGHGGAGDHAGCDESDDPAHGALPGDVSFEWCAAIMRRRQPLARASSPTAAAA